MKTEEKFKIWDATEPSIPEIRDYLNRICGKAPLTLVYKNTDGTLKYCHEVLNEPFVGIMIEDIIFYAKGFENKDMYDENCKLVWPDISVENVNKWLSQNSQLFPTKPHLLNKRDALLLSTKQKDLNLTLQILDYHHSKNSSLKMPKFRYSVGWHDSNRYSTSVFYANGSTTMKRYLEEYGDFWFCSDKP